MIALQEVFGEYGFPKRFFSDGGIAFTSKQFKEFMMKHGIRQMAPAILSTIATPRANGKL